jgi:NAD(P)-dependent dehydrogenase (short-subunit alcohol dehydrogenase family)
MNRSSSSSKNTIPGQALAVEADVTNPAECSQIVDYALSTFGRLDILVNVVGVLGARGTAVDVDLEEWNYGMEVNVTSMMLMAKYAVPAMLRDKPVAEGEPQEAIRGSIVNVGSVAGLRGGTAHLLYPTSKGAVVNMTRAMAAQHGREGVRVNCVCPGEFYSVVFLQTWVMGLLLTKCLVVG